MNKEKFEQRLEKQQSTPLYQSISKYQHVERLGNSSVEGLLEGDVVVQTKIDGANLTVAYLEGIGHIIASRNTAISIGENPKTGFNGAIEYCLDHPGIMALSERYILRGEWLVRHSMNYPKEYMQHFYVFDVQRYEDESYVHPNEYIPLLQTYGIKYIPTLVQLTNPTIEDLMTLAKGPDKFGAEQKEGVVIKRYDFVNKYGRTQWGKIVHEEFKIKNKLMFNPQRADGLEIKFASGVVSKQFILKVINKIKDETENNDITIKQMPRILGVVWYDVFTEELWDFVKKNRVKEFDFSKAKKLVETATREIALAYFNGILNDY